MSLQIQVTADVANAGKQIEDFSKKSRIALTSLSLVAQDLPFGFIGIQNNLPSVISSFGELTREAGGVGGALKQLGSALIGPAGLFLAFSAATAAVTFAIQKYGSFGAAVDALFGKINPLSKVIKDAAKSQQDFNESYKTTGQILASASGSIEAQIIKVKLLSDTVINLKNSEEIRKNALSELQKIDKAYFGQITTAIGDVDKLEAATRKYTEAILANAIAKAYEQKVTQGAINLEEQRNLLKDLAPAYAEATKKQKEFLKSYEDAYDPVTGAKLVQPSFITTKDIEAFNKQKLVVDAAVISLDKLKQSFKNATLEALNFVEPIKEGSDAIKEFYSNFPDSNALGPVEAFSRFVIGSTNLQVKSIQKLIQEKKKNRKLDEDLAVALAPKTISGKVDPLKNQKFLDTQAIAAEFAIARELIDGVFFNPIAESFENFINTGKFTFDEFAKNIKANIAKIVAQIAASKIVSLLGAIFAGPIAGGLAGGGGFLSAIGNLLPAFRSNTSFDGVRPLATGGGQKIDLILRGTDLVGAINRTNEQISRVG